MTVKNTRAPFLKEGNGQSKVDGWVEYHCKMGGTNP